MEDLDISIGTSLNMQLMVGESKRRHDVQVIGYLKGESFLVTMPQENGAMATIFPQDEYIVRYFKGKNIVAFRTRILHVAKVPYFHLHLEFPTKLETVKIRQAERINISIKAQTLAGGKKYASLIQDLSAGGAQVIVGEEVGNPGEHIELFFGLKIAEIEEKIHLIALIRNIRKEKNELTGKIECRYGVEFMDPSDHEIIFMQGFVYEQLLKNRDRELQKHD